MLCLENEIKEGNIVALKDIPLSLHAFTMLS